MESTVLSTGHAGVEGNDRADRLAGTQHWHCGVYCTVLDMPESEEMTEQIDAGKATISYRRLASRKIFGSVEGLEKLPAEHKAKDITPSIALRRERRRKRKLALNDLPGEDEKGPSSSIRPTLGLFQGQHWGKLLKDGMECIWAFPSA